MKIVSIVGARPEFIQASAVSTAIRRNHQEVLIHTGQHYDYQMSQAFFDEMELPKPDYNLEVGSGTQAYQTAEIMVRLERVLLEEKPDLVIVRGDTNSTIAGALVAKKMHLYLAHIEAGERSFDMRMPEEINRLVTDRISDLHLCASRRAVNNLAQEGIVKNVHWVGDVMFDAMLKFQVLAKQKSKILEQLDLSPQSYCLTTIHRSANTNDPKRLANIIRALNQAWETIVFPIHPRTRKAIKQYGLSLANNIQVIKPASYFDMITLEENARLIATDSGGVQREAYFLGIPCLTLREETEWEDTVIAGWNCLVGPNPEKILYEWAHFKPPAEKPPIFGDGKAGEHIAQILSEQKRV